MSSFRLCVFLIVMVVQFQYIVSKPFLDGLLCDLFCDDDDDSSTTTTSTSTEDYFDFFGLCDCRPTTRRPGVGRRRGQGFPPVFNMRLPPSINGMNLTMGNTNGVWSFNLDALPNGVLTPLGGFTTPGPITIGSATTAGATTAVGTTAAATTAKK